MSDSDYNARRFDWWPLNQKEDIQLPKDKEPADRYCEACVGFIVNDWSDRRICKRCTDQYKCTNHLYSPIMQSDGMYWVCRRCGKDKPG